VDGSSLGKDASWFDWQLAWESLRLRVDCLWPRRPHLKHLIGSL